jgi:organic radical activating enzyme
MTMTQEHQFLPDLIIEVTNQCDKRCVGCYAPNIFSAGPESSARAAAKNLSLVALERAWANHSVLNSARCIGIRGGEPTLNPEIVSILKFFDKVKADIYLETHGEWIDKDTGFLGTLSKLKTIVKLSVDKMHESSFEQTINRIQLLSAYNIPHFIAVTASTLEEFYSTTSQIVTQPSCKFIFQRKSASFEHLVKPSIGVVTAGGTLSKTVSVRPSFTKTKVAMHV